MKFPKLNDPKLAEFVGILLGDGCIGLYKCKSGPKIKNQYKIQITINSKDDAEYSKYIKKLFYYIFHVELHTSLRKNEMTCDLRIFRKEIFNFLVNKVGLKISPKWNTAKIPEIYMKGDLKRYVLKGYFDTDGSVVITKNNGILYPRIEAKICPSPMKAQFIKILRDLELKFGVYNIGKGKIRIQINGMIQMEKWMKLIGFSNQKHLKKIRLARGRFELPTFTQTI